MYIHEYHMEGTVSQIFDIGPSSHFMKSRKVWEFYLACRSYWEMYCLTGASTVVLAQSRFSHRIKRNTCLADVIVIT